MLPPPAAAAGHPSPGASISFTIPGTRGDKVPVLPPARCLFCRWSRGAAPQPSWDALLTPLLCCPREWQSCRRTFYSRKGLTSNSRFFSDSKCCHCLLPLVLWSQHSPWPMAPRKRLFPGHTLPKRTKLIIILGLCLHTLPRGNACGGRTAQGTHMVTPKLKIYLRQPKQTTAQGNSAAAAGSAGCPPAALSETLPGLQSCFCHQTQVKHKPGS